MPFFAWICALILAAAAAAAAAALFLVFALAFEGLSVASRVTGLRSRCDSGSFRDGDLERRSVSKRERAGRSGSSLSKRDRGRRSSDMFARRCRGGGGELVVRRQRPRATADSSFWRLGCTCQSRLAGHRSGSQKFWAFTLGKLCTQSPAQSTPPHTRTPTSSLNYLHQG